MIIPMKGMAFVIEDVADNLKAYNILKEQGFVQSDAHTQNAGVSGIVHAVGENEQGVKEGDHVIYSRLIAEQVIVNGDDGKPMKNLRQVPCDSISAFIR